VRSLISNNKPTSASASCFQSARIHFDGTLDAAARSPGTRLKMKRRGPEPARAMSTPCPGGYLMGASTMIICRPSMVDSCST